MYAVKGNREYKIDEVEKDTYISNGYSIYSDELEIMTLETEEGEREVGIIGVFGIEEQEYIALLSLETEEVMVYRYYEKEDGEFELGSIESDEEYEMVEEVFNTLYVDEDESEEE